MTVGSKVAAADDIDLFEISTLCAQRVVQYSHSATWREKLKQITNNEDVPEEVKLLVKLCKTEMFASEVWLFGSRARGNNSPESDFDILAVVPDEPPEDVDTPHAAFRLRRRSKAHADLLSQPTGLTDLVDHIVGGKSGSLDHVRTSGCTGSCSCNTSNRRRPSRREVDPLRPFEVRSQAAAQHLRSRHWCLVQHFCLSCLPQAPF